MPVKKLQFKPGVLRENTRYNSEGGWYDCDKIRFRYGTPEKIGGWTRLSNNTYNGVARSMWPWSSLGGTAYLGVGTNTKYYVMYGGFYYDITPIRAVTSPGDVSFSVTAGSNIMTVTDAGHGCITGDFVTFSGATGFGGNVTAAVIDQEYQVTVVDVNTYTVVLPVVANVYDDIYLDLDFVTDTYDEWDTTETAVATYQINTGAAIEIPISGWGAGGWSAGAWGIGSSAGVAIRIWNHQNFGEDLIFGPKGGALYYWDLSVGVTTRGVALDSLPGASDVPLYHNLLLIADSARIVLAFGTTDYGASSVDPMLIRWSDQESAVNWTPAATTQAGSLRLTRGSEIIGVAQVRQEILVWTNTSLYSLQYLGPPIVFGSQVLADGITIINDRCMATAAGITYWMGNEKFYVYDGRVNTLPCDVRQYVFEDFNKDQDQQVFASTVEQYNEVWWFYCSANSTEIDRYVVYNYIEKAWYYGTMARTYWIDSGVLSEYPVAATYSNLLTYQEFGTDDIEGISNQPITAYIESSEFDIDDGDRFMFVWRMLPDVTFRGSLASNPSVTFTLKPLQNSGSGYNSPASLGGSDNAPVTRTAVVPVEQFTGQVNIRVRGRQMAMRVESNALGVQWQLGSPRFDVRLDGRKS